MRFSKRKNYVRDEDVQDTPSRLFRSIIRAKGVDASSWKTYLDGFLRIMIPDNPKDIEGVKKDRSTALGNLNDALWSKPTLTFNKLITGLQILKYNKVTITITAVNDDGSTQVVKEEVILNKESKE